MMLDKQLTTIYCRLIAMTTYRDDELGAEAIEYIGFFGVVIVLIGAVAAVLQGGGIDASISVIRQNIDAMIGGLSRGW